MLPRCSASMTEESVFCNRCGQRMASETLSDVSGRIGDLEKQLKEFSSARGPQQNYLEVETAQRVMQRVE